jgi:predicted transcriptional regulator
MPFSMGGDREALLLDTRRRIFEIVRDNAGIHARDVQRKSMLALGNVSYHLDYLRKKGLLRADRSRKITRYYCIQFKEDRLMGLLRQKSVRDIILYVMMNEGCSHEEISRELALSPSTVTWHLSKLKDIVREERTGRTKSYRLCAGRDRIMKLLVAYRESFLDKMVDNAVRMWEFR